MTMRSVRLLLWAAVVAAALLAGWFLVLAPRLQRTVEDTIGRGDYSLDATDGGTFSEAALRGQPSAVFFGFTHCPDVCPTTLGDIGVWQEELGADAGKVRFCVLQYALGYPKTFQ